MENTGLRFTYEVITLQFVHDPYLFPPSAIVLAESFSRNQKAQVEREVYTFPPSSLHRCPTRANEQLIISFHLHKKEEEQKNEIYFLCFLRSSKMSFRREGLVYLFLSSAFISSLDLFVVDFFLFCSRDLQMEMEDSQILVRGAALRSFARDVRRRAGLWVLLLVFV